MAPTYGDGDGLAAADRRDDVAELGERRLRHRLDPHVQDTAAGEPHGEGVVVAKPYRAKTGAPEATTPSASWYTAASTQPPDTLPTTAPSGPTAIAAPG
jgi:hypothetical protein